MSEDKRRREQVRGRVRERVREGYVGRGVVVSFAQGRAVADGGVEGAGGVVVEYCRREGDGDDCDGRVARVGGRVGEW